jgi:hypothetical protein
MTRGIETYTVLLQVYLISNAWICKTDLLTFKAQMSILITHKCNEPGYLNFKRVISSSAQSSLKYPSMAWCAAGVDQG